LARSSAAICSGVSIGAKPKIFSPRANRVPRHAKMTDRTIALNMLDLEGLPEDSV